MDAAQIPMELAQGGRAADTSIFSGATQAMPQRAESPDPVNIGVKPFPGLDVNAEQQKAYSLAEAKGAYDEEQPKREARIRDRESLTPYAHKLATAKGVQEVLDGMGDRLAPETVQELTKHRLELEKGDISLYQARLKGDSAKWEAKDDQERRAVDALAPAAEVYRSTLLETKDLAKAQQAYDSAKQEAIPQLAQLKDPMTGQPLFPPDKITALQQMPADKLDMMVKTLHGYNERSADIAKRVKLEADASRSEAVAKYGSGYKGQMLARMQAQLQAKVDRGEIGQADMDKQLLDYEKTALGGGNAANQVNETNLPAQIEMALQGVAIPMLTGQGGQAQRGAIERGAIERLMKEGMTQEQAAAEFVARQQGAKANQAALTANFKDVTKIRPYMEMVHTNIDKLEDLTLAVSRTDKAILNKPLGWVMQNLGDHPEWAEFAAQVRFVQAEANRVINNPNLSGTLAYEAQKEMDKVLNADMPIRAMYATLERIRSDSENRLTAMEKEGGRRRESPTGAKAKTPPDFPRVDMDKADATSTSSKQQERANLQKTVEDVKAPREKRRAAMAAIAAIDQELQGKESTSTPSPALNNAKAALPKDGDIARAAGKPSLIYRNGKWETYSE